MIGEFFNLRPKAIERTLKLRLPLYLETAAYGHMARKNEVEKENLYQHVPRRENY